MVNNTAERDSIQGHKKYIAYWSQGKKGKDERSILWYPTRQATILQLKPSCTFQDNVFMVPFTQPRISLPNNLQIDLIPCARNSHSLKFTCHLLKQGVFKKRKYGSVKTTGGKRKDYQMCLVFYTQISPILKRELKQCLERKE